MTNTKNSIPIFLVFLFLLFPQISDAQLRTKDIYICMYYAPMQKAHNMMHDVYQGVAHSPDFGISWESLGWVTSRVNDITRIANTDTLFLSTDYGILSSSDAGMSWKQLSGWDVGVVFRTLVHNSNIWIATETGPFRSTDNGKSWEHKIQGLSSINSQYTSDIIVSGTRIIIATADGLYSSVNNGASWSKAGLNDFEIQRIIPHPGSSNTIAATSYGTGLWLSYDSAKTWENMSDKLYSNKIQSFSFYPDNPDAMLIGTQDFPISKSIDAGKTWTTSNGGMTNNNVTALCVDPNDASIVFAGTENGTWISKDGGSSWKHTTPRFGYVRSIKILY